MTSAIACVDLACGALGESGLACVGDVAAGLRSASASHGDDADPESPGGEAESRLFSALVGELSLFAGLGA
jgi:hypothetical protein